MARVRATRSVALTALFVSVFCAAAIAKDAPEAALLREGRLYEAAQVLQKLTKDEAAQRRSAELYLRLALYERALDRLVAAGMGRSDAAVFVVSEAFGQGNRFAALRLARATGLAEQATAEFARRELAEGRARSALRFARESGDAALIAAAGRAAYEESINASPFIIGYRSSAPHRIGFSPDGRFLIVRDCVGAQVEIVDTWQRASRSVGERGRFLSTGLQADAYAIDGSARYIAVIGRSRDAVGKELAVFHMERLDTGLVVQQYSLPSRYPKAKTSLLVFAGDLLCAAAGKTALLFDPWTGEVKASASIEEGLSSIEFVEAKNLLVCRYSGNGKTLVLNAGNLQVSREPYAASEDARGLASPTGAGMAYSEERRLYVVVPPSSIEDVRVESDSGRLPAKTGPLSKPLTKPVDLSYSGGVDAALSPDGLVLAILAREGIVLAPFPFLDREDTAASLAREFGQTENFAPLCGYLIDQGRLEEARRLWSLAGVDDATIFRMFAEAKFRRGDTVDAALDFIEAGMVERALGIADSLVDAASSEAGLAIAFADGAAIYGKAKERTNRLAAAAGRRAEAIAAPAAAVNYYVIAASRDDIERLAFDPNLASVEWCLFAGGKLGLAESEIYARAVSILERQKKWGEAAVAFLWLRNDQGLSRVAKAALAGSDWDYVLLDALKKRADPTLCRAAAESLLAKGELVYAAEQFAAVADLAGVARVADRAVDADDFLFAAELYSALGTKSAKAATAARLKLVYDEIGLVIQGADAYLSQEVVDGVNAGRIPIQWPVPQAKAEEPSYLQVKRFGDAIAALASAPRSAEAKRCASYLSKEAIKTTKATSVGQPETLLRRAAMFNFAARLLAAMGK